MYKKNDTGAWTPNGLFFATPMGYNLWEQPMEQVPLKGAHLAQGMGCNLWGRERGNLAAHKVATYGVQPMGARMWKCGGPQG